MNYYGAKDLAASFRTVRKNTLIIAEDIPEDKYSYRPAEGSRAVGELLSHIALGGRFQEQVNLIEKRSSMEGFDFMKFMGGIMAEAAKPRTKAEILALLKDEGERYAKALESLADDFLGQSVSMPPGGSPPSRTRFDMLASVKEHEMHHRGQLMLIERLLGITPHLTRENQARRAAMRAGTAHKDTSVEADTDARVR
ncbi:MAG TPA: DinB family protein [Bryobacteraceae bacterium]|nr:DinB family protein [Bryobacteraceae bacterium]